MPTPIQSPSLFVEAAPLAAPLQARLQELASAYGGHRGLREAGHVVHMAAVAQRSFLKSRLAEPAQLKQELADTAELANALTDLGPTTGPLPASHIKLSLWQCLAALRRFERDDRVFTVVGAMCSLAASGQREIKQKHLRALLMLAIALGGERQETAARAFLMVCSILVDRADRRFRQRFARWSQAASTGLERSVERTWCTQLAFENRDLLKGVVPPSGLSGSLVNASCAALKRAASNGCAWSLAIAIGVWLGLSLFMILSIELLAPTRTGLLRITSDCCGVEVDLSGVLLHLARRSGGETKPTDDLLLLPLPLWISDLLLPLRHIDPDQTSLAGLLGLNPRAIPRQIDALAADLRDQVSIPALIRSRSQPLMEPVIQSSEVRHTDALLVAYANLDFSRVTKSQLPYHHIPIADVRAMALRRCAAYGWGPLAPQPPADHGVGSRNTPTDALMAALVASRREALQTAPHGQHTDWPVLEGLYNALVRYTMLMAAVAWVLRGITIYGVTASILWTFRQVGWTDKLVGAGEGVTRELRAGALLGRQFVYVQSTAEAMVRRAEKLIAKGRAVPPAALAHLRAIAAGDAGVSLFAVIDGDTVRACGARDLNEGITLNWPAVRDAVRHAGADGYRAVLDNAVDAELLLRHLAQQCRLHSDAVALSSTEWWDDALHAQDRLLQRFGLGPIPGLVGRLNPCKRSTER